MMDLRFYQSVEENVPFRYCRPFRCEALVMMGILLRSRALGGVAADVAGMIVPMVK